MWTLYFTKQAKKDAHKLAVAGLKEKTEKLLNVLRENPYQNPPSYEKLVGDLMQISPRNKELNPLHFGGLKRLLL